MNKLQLITKLEIAHALANGVLTLASAKTPDEHAEAVKQLSSVFESAEIALIVHLLEPRIRCEKCNLGQSRNRASGPLCSSCADALKASLDLYPTT